MRNNFVFYTSYYECIKELPTDMQGELYKAIIEYAMEQKEPNLSGLAKGIFAVIRPTLDKSQKQYENGIKGGRPKNEENPNEPQSKPKEQTNKNPTKTQEETKSTTNKNLENNKKNNSEQELAERKNKQKENSTVLTDSEIVQIVYNSFKSEKVAKRFLDYVECRRAKGKSSAIRTMATLKLNICKVFEYGHSDDEMIGILDYSIANSYQGIFNIYKNQPMKNADFVSAEEEASWSH